MSRTRRIKNRRCGFTLIEVAAIVAAVSVLISLAGAISGSNVGPRDTARQVKEATQLFGIGQSLIMWAHQNRDRYPLPSTIDRDNFTVADLDRAKDHSANIYSILIFNGSFPQNILISPAERNAQIKPDEDYQISEPKAAVDPVRALWDPAFSIDFTNDHTGNASFAHLEVSNDRLPIWHATYQANQAVVATRGPEITSLKVKGESVIPTLANDDSITLSLHKPSGMFAQRGHRWSGSVVYNDNSVIFAENYIQKSKEGGYQPMPLDGPVPISLRDPMTRALRPDVLFFDEPEHPANMFLGLFTTAGTSPKDYKAIWD